jgi:membrane protease YdiL (CAAX protease family)
MSTDISVELTEATSANFPSIWVSAIWIILFFVAQVIFGVLAVLVAVALADDMERALSQIGDLKSIALPTIWGLVASNAAISLGLWAYLRRNDRFAKIGFNRWSSISLVKTLALAIAVIAGGLAFNYIYSEYIFKGVEMQKELKELFAAIPKTIPNNILLFLAVAIFAPLLEEFLFRGLLQNSLMPMMPAAAAILLSAAIFAGVHMDKMAFAPIFVLGAAFGYLYHVTGSLRVCILMHMVNNGAALALG